MSLVWYQLNQTQKPQLFMRIPGKEAEAQQLQELYASIGRTSHPIKICLSNELKLYRRELRVKASQILKSCRTTRFLNLHTAGFWLD